MQETKKKKKKGREARRKEEREREREREGRKGRRGEEGRVGGENERKKEKIQELLDSELMNHGSKDMHFVSEGHYQQMIPSTLILSSVPLQDYLYFPLIYTRVWGDRS